MAVARLRRRAYRELQHRAPRTYLWLQRDADLHRVNRHTQLAIVGYPGSANSFARAAFLHANSGATVASHAHTWSELADAVRLRVPALLIVREPVDAVASRLARFQVDSPGAALLDYARFYERTARWAPRVVVADFRQVTTAFGAVLERLNARYGTAFHPYPDADPAAATHLHALLARANGAVPGGAERRVAIEAAKASLVLPAHQRRLERCRAVYRALSRLAEEQERCLA